MLSGGLNKNKFTYSCRYFRAKYLFGAEFFSIQPLKKRRKTTFFKQIKKRPTKMNPNTLRMPVHIFLTKILHKIL